MGFRETKTLLACGAALALAGAPVTASAQQRTFNLPAQPATKSIPEFARQAGVQIVAPGSRLRNIRTRALSGQQDVRAALRLLLEGTGLTIVADDGRTITIAQGKPHSTSEASGGNAPASDAAGEQGEDIVVTGSNIRNAHPTSPVTTVTRRDIDNSGFTQIGDLMRSLPQNFSGGQNPGVLAADGTNIENRNVSNASTMNLRGLGTGATLTLLNGRRLSPDALFQGADISVIPLAAIERVEIVADGASAIYGSDAVAGVVNFILRKDYTGTEIGANLGVATQGGGFAQNYNILKGIAREGWRVLGSYQYSDQNGIRAGQREFTSASAKNASLLRAQKSHSVYLNGAADLTDTTEISIDGLYSHRNVNHTIASGPAYYDTVASTSTYSVSAGITQRIGDWNLRFNGGGAGSRNLDRLVGFTPSFYKNSVRYAEFIADGDLLDLPSGSVKLAIGGGYRRDNHASTTVTTISHDVKYLFGELMAPVVAPSPSRVGMHELDVNLSARTERYSDFGSATSPRVGLRYVPLRNLTLRGSWGKSFKAPTFAEMYQPRSMGAYAGTRFGLAATDQALLIVGGNPDLAPERSRSWTFGAEFRAPAPESPRVSATYFDIAYQGRVVNPVTSIFRGFSDPIYAPFLLREPSAELQAELISTATFYNFTGSTYDPAAVRGLLYNITTNASAQKVRGWDVTYQQAFDVGGGSLGTFASGTWLKLDQQTISTVPSRRLSGTIFNVPSFKGRAGLSWTSRAFVANAIVNHIAGERDTGLVPEQRIGSWTTFDANIAYTFRGPGVLDGVRLSLAASNLFDRDPPFAPSAGGGLFPGLNFDSTNASVIGRFVNVSIRKAW